MVETTLKSSIKLPLILISIMWIMKISEAIFDLSLIFLGILPQSKNGAIGIFTSIFIHGDFNHLIANTLPFFLLTSALFYFYRKNSYKIFFFSYFLSGILVWLFARNAYHIGASGLIYSFASFFFFNGVFRKNVKAITLSVTVLFLYGGLVTGIFPSDESISWEGHLFGVISGIISAILFSDNENQKKYDWEDEDISQLPPPEISYKKGYPFE